MRRRVPVTVALRSGLRGLPGDLQKEEGTSTFPWVPGTGPGLAKARPFPPVKTRRGYCPTDSEDARMQVQRGRGRPRGRARRSLCVPNARFGLPEHARARYAQDGHARLAGIGHGGDRNANTTRYHYGTRKGKEGGAEHHLGVAGEGLDDTEEEVVELAVDEEEDPWVRPFLRERYRLPQALKPIGDGAQLAGECS